ncbi:hypothetical protein HOE22_06490 [Candidatus Woesearchaeota archaeon]|jgi:hypothetical protein|nr:hypothetical protein [Candidatus Woesearchaeota archaeon]MBT4731774.1 hypothetical protein [Candidatus Woesearchaeota archaeon]MBT7557925.1 hypothetical protein [Candidatus Woesearchaeota archaeon]
MGRKKIYKTKDELKDAQKKWQMEHYQRNKDKILQQAKDRYLKKKRQKQREDKRRRLYGDQ